MADSPLAQLQFLINSLQAIQATRYCELAAGSIVIFDHLITLDDEIRLIWKRSWSFGKGLFLANRYYTLAAFIFNIYAFFSPKLTDSFCTRFFQWQGWSGWLICILAEGILQMRIYALYSMNKKVLTLMLFWFMASSSLSIWVLAKQLSTSAGQALAIPLPGGKFCAPTTTISNFYAFWIPILSFESLLCVLAVISGFRSYKRSPRAFRRSGAMGLVSILVRDSIAYFLVIGGTYLTCLLIWVLAPPSFIDTPVGFAMAMSCVLGNRVLLNVRQAALDSSVHMSWHRQEDWK